jgi:hypothetical protein
MQYRVVYGISDCVLKQSQHWSAQIAFLLAVHIHGQNDGGLVKSTLCGALHKAEDYSLAAVASTVRSWHEAGAAHLYPEFPQWPTSSPSSFD